MSVPKWLVVVNGKPEAGKDTFVDFCMAQLSMRGFHSKKISSVDGVKEAARSLGWDGVKDARGRKFLSDLKDLSTQAYEGPMKHMTQALTGTTAQVAFLFIREPEEIAKFKEAYPHAVTVLVVRPCKEVEGSNHADNRVREYPYDAEVANDRMLDTLFHVAGHFVDGLLSSFSRCECMPTCTACTCNTP